LNGDESMNPKMADSRKRGFFDQRAKSWDEISVHNLEKVQYIIELLEIQGDDRILDIGTGTGILIPFYERHLVDGRIVAVDHSEKMIEVARSKYPEERHPLVSYMVSDVYELTHEAEFDLVVCYSCFPHFVDQPLVIRILSRALRQGGRLAVAHSDSARKINEIHMNGGVEIGKDFLPSMELLKQMMKESGLATTFERDDECYFICLARKT
jgi:ubiquinone/menaquinone biosynthesis C-methylase UbiE